jgi:hypothetical protein
LLKTLTVVVIMIIIDLLCILLCRRYLLCGGQHGRIARHWAISTGEIEQLDVSCMTLSGTISRGWRNLVERERQELNETVQSLNDA